MDNWGLNEVFPRVSVFCAYIRFPDLKDLMICTNPYSTRLFKEIYQDSDSISYKKSQFMCKLCYQLFYDLQQKRF